MIKHDQNVAVKPAAHNIAHAFCRLTDSLDLKRPLSMIIQTYIFSLCFTCLFAVKSVLILLVIFQEKHFQDWSNFDYPSIIFKKKSCWNVSDLITRRLRSVFHCRAMISTSLQNISNLIFRGALLSLSYDCIELYCIICFETTELWS